MRKNVILVADFSHNEVHGGSELYSKQLLELLQRRGCKTMFIKSADLTQEDIEKGDACYWIISNFMLLSEQNKTLIMKNVDYVILEHDAKLTKNNNPAAFKNLIIPEEQIQNKDFYKKAIAVLCQSKSHADIFTKNLLLNNVINLGCNLWDEDTLALLEKNIGRTKVRKYGVLSSNNKNKGMSQTIEYCKKNNIKYELISPLEQKMFIEELAKTDTLVFFPQWFESYSRLAVEARILGCKLITNKCLGVSSEPYFNLKGLNLLRTIEFHQQKVIDIYMLLIENQYTSADELEEPKKVFPYELEPILPKVSVIATYYNGAEHMKGFMETIVQQTIFDSCELILIDANSPYSEYEIIKPYLDKYQNIKYYKTDIRLSSMEAVNLATNKYSTGEFITTISVDDRLSKNYLEVMSKHLFLDKDVDLVYADALQTLKPNETFENNTSRGRLYEHSRAQFSRENMIKSLGGMAPMYRRSLHDKVGGWDETLKNAGDWAFQLKAARMGSIFKKVNIPLILYFFNSQGLSTSQDPEIMLRRRKEERDVFNEYKDVIGEKNYNTYKDYFNSVE